MIVIAIQRVRLDQKQAEIEIQRIVGIVGTGEACKGMLLRKIGADLVDVVKVVGDPFEDRHRVGDGSGQRLAGLPRGQRKCRVEMLATRCRRMNLGGAISDPAAESPERLAHLGYAVAAYAGEMPVDRFGKMKQSWLVGAHKLAFRLAR